MNGIVIVFPRLWVNAMALFPFIIVKSKADSNDEVLLNHERIHLRQQLELLIFPFYLLYFINYLLNRFKFDHHYQAYKHIVFEREAYQMEKDLAYLQKRKFWAWLNF